ncbi:MAG: hypothetical protein ACKOBS_05315, partial [Verrucomicrobiota bacterium]
RAGVDPRRLISAEAWRESFRLLDAEIAAGEQALAVLPAPADDLSPRRRGPAVAARMRLLLTTAAERLALACVLAMLGAAATALFVWRSL